MNKQSRMAAGLLTIGLLLGACTGATRPSAELAAESVDTSREATKASAAAAKKAAAAAGVKSAGSSATVGGGGPATVAPGGGGGGTTAYVPRGPRLFDAAQDRIGITDDKIVICAHAALNYGAAFDTSADDLNVYWSEVNAKGGVNGRKVEVTYENDNYSGPDAIAAAERCKAKNPALIIGGIGFDQIPSVRDWAEKNKSLYVHHTATEKGSAGKQYSFTPLPSTEKSGEMFAELALWKFRNKKIGIIGRDSINWTPGIAAFKKVAAGRLNIVKEIYTPKDHHNYGLEIREMQRAGAEVVWGWESALAAIEMWQQAKAINYDPTWMLFPFNLVSQTLGDQALSPKAYGIAMYQAYSKGDYTGEFAKYAGDMKEFERQYAKWRPRANLEGIGGDLLFLNWSGMKGLHYLLQTCGRDCTRNKIADVIRTTKVARNGSVCAADFSRPGHPMRGGWQVSAMETYRSPSGKVNWRNISTCVEHLPH